MAQCIVLCHKVPSICVCNETYKNAIIFKAIWCEWGELAHFFYESQPEIILVMTMVGKTLLVSLPGVSGKKNNQINYRCNFIGNTPVSCMI